MDDAQWLDFLARSENVLTSDGRRWHMIESWEETSSPDCEPEAKSWAYVRHYAKLVRITAMPQDFEPKWEVRHEP